MFATLTEAVMRISPLTRPYRPSTQTLGAVGVAVAVLLLCHLPVRGDEPKKADEAKKPEVRWEYASLDVYARGGPRRYLWATQSEEYAVESWGALATELKLETKATGAKVKLAVFDHLGGQGWELASHSTAVTTNGGSDHHYTFKRKVK